MSSHAENLAVIDTISTITDAADQLREVVQAEHDWLERRVKQGQVSMYREKERKAQLEAMLAKYDAAVEAYYGEDG